MINENLMVSGYLTVEIYRDDMLTDIREIKNMVVNDGKTLLAKMLVGISPKPSHIALGTGTVPPTVANIGLGIESANTRMLPSELYHDENVTTYIAAWNPGVATGTYTEAGIFNNGIQGMGTLFARTSFSPIVKTAGDKLVVTWNIRIN